MTQIRPYVSPSQLTTFQECPRKWGWEKLEGMRSIQKKSAALGERVHAILEDWLRSAKPPPQDETFLIDEKIYYPGRIAESGIHLLPPPGSGFVESTFAWRIFNGRIDFAWKGPECPAVLDHKTTSDLGYAKTTEDLKTDPQAIVYASAALEETDAQAVDLFWVYYKTSKPYKAQRVHLRVTREYATEQLRPLEARAHMMLELRRSGARALDLPPNANACGNYGGCDFVKHCNLSSQEIMRSMYMAEMSLEEKIKAHKAAQNGAAIPPLPASVGAPQLPGGVPAVPLPHVPVVPAVPALAPQVPAVPPAIPAVPAPVVAAPVPRWIEHPGNPAYEWLEGTDQTRLKQAPVPAAAAPDPFNAPEAAHTTERAQPPPAPPPETEKDESLAGDAFDTMDGDALKAFAKQHGLEPKKNLREKNLRIAVRTLWAAKASAPQAPAVPAVPAAAPPPHVPPALPVVPAAALPQVPPALPGPQAFAAAVSAPVPQVPATGFFAGDTGNGAPLVPKLEPDEARLFGALRNHTRVERREHHITMVVAAMIAAREPYADSLDLARTANSIVEAIERVSREAFPPEA